MKKIISLVTAAVLATTLFVGCGSGKEKGGKEGKELKVGVALYKFDDTFISTVRDAIKENSDAKSKETGEKIVINAVDGQGQQATQNDQVDTFITQGYDVIAVNMVDRTAASVLIEKAEKANIPVVFFNREPVKEDMDKWNKMYYVGAKAEESGAMQGQIIADYWKKNPTADKNKDGKLQYVMLEGEPGHQDAILRTEHSIKELEKQGVKTEKLATDTANWQRAQGQEKMSAWLSAYGDKVEAVFANNDDMALGAIEALKAAGYYKEDKFIPVVGVDATAPALDSLKAGEMLGTVLNDAKNQGKAIFDIAYSLAKEEDPTKSVEGITDGKYKWVPYKPITKENLKDIEK
ncbi:galactose ABC transporter substrate-binding protein [Clostridium tetani]|uniref:D-galactose/methyl-galactoside binding periplasmic protein MglB n=1 Tax=Clostridium tetani TaxID=1513 RepID=A0A4Q0VGJ0_CLOTA|nr:galactose ABC transporter substrate-binding protein [Clostridium tetani]RXI50449.1 galactose/glucose ABC transporter substrate-binding protein MglB [Clostridium tetani]BDR66454.1 galactose ABC transporter substrate-binding protein [Clostridium tetani]BDR71955.1 galactose ABC transporter substrate-binding protein [Clostridium tetani]BDR80430.1 galactose ABC transporter substrate-binding protein [Clostridium tetani]BDR88885.1 galactose ABC transporter substrate-binding protein [Clostridium te